ncbi:hypothetical protein [Pyrococcus yayanosii]|uniref:Uncharacterized protein n=1 Tax=Pyrococcus yayanosii (strain CH1 / JCM 16557) TaxID=529709 RepID=F8AIH3_PYRYC|nr:hypothetical protein [Pyrococcus yayanosii]AEH23792.1 hypothetical protein PYCH_00790 [Pyrococcus yayanosii CH1]
MKKFIIGGIFIFMLSFFILSLLINGNSGNVVLQFENNTPPQQLIKTSNNAYRASETKSEVTPPSPSDFILPYVGYIYGTPNDTVAQVMLYWCYPKSVVNQSVAISVTMNFGGSFLSVSYNGEDIPVFYHGYLGIILPINFSQLNLSAPGNYKYLDVSGDLYWIQNGRKQRIRLNLGNWTFETVNEEQKLKPNITAFSLESIEFKEGTREVKYSFGLYNPFNVTMRLINVSFGIPSKLVKIVNIEVYNTSTPYEIAKSKLMSSKLIPPEESRYFVITLEINGKVRSLFIQPKLVYSIGDEVYTMAGPPFQDTVLPVTCTYNMKAS